jgi:phosphate transport system permease protein
MAVDVPAFDPDGRAVIRGKREPISAWPLLDRAGVVLCWCCGIAMCLAAAGIVLFMLVKGIGYLRPGLLVQSPTAAVDQSQAGGFFDPIIGTLLLTGIGIAVAAPLGIAVAAWLSEYGRPAGLARAVDSGIEMIAGVPSIVLAIFGVAVFARGIFAPLSERSAGGHVVGKSFLVAGLMMSLLALPLVVTATREALAQIPSRTREASYALGKTRATTLRKVLLPSIRPSIASGVTLGMGRIIGDTAIVVFLLGFGMQLSGAGGAPGLSTLRGQGSTLTTYVYSNSPSGEGNAPEKAYAAAFVLLLMVLALNAIVTRLSRGHERVTQ